MYQDYLHCIANFCATVLNIFSNEVTSNVEKKLSSYETLETFYIFSFRKYKKDCNILKVILVQGVCQLKIEIAQYPIMIGFRVHALVSLTFL